MHGDRAIREIRKMGFEVPIIALTGNAFDHEKDMLLAAGADHFLSKPTTISKIEETLLLFPQLRGSYSGSPKSTTHIQAKSLLN
jgi:two-component system capsular synthesis sensor histidine kinase RcsC